MLHRRSSSIAIGILTLASLVALTVSAAAQMSLVGDRSKSVGNSTLKSNRQIVSLASPSSGPSRQIVDLRNGVGQFASGGQLPNADYLLQSNSNDLPTVPDSPLDRLALAPSGQDKKHDRPSPGSEAWVDAVIPKELFEQANVAPRGAESLGAFPDLPKVPTDLQSNADSAKTTESQENSGAQVNSNSSAKQTPALEAMQGAPPAHDSASRAPFAPREQRVPGQTFAPQQAIPNSVYQDAGQQPPSSNASNSASDPRLAEPPQAAPDRQARPEEVEAVPVEPRTRQPANNSSKHNSSKPTNLESESGVRSPATSHGGADDRPQADSDSATNGPQDKSKGNGKKEKEPLLQYTPADYFPSRFDALARATTFQPGDFMDRGGPQGSTFNPLAAAAVYRGKFNVPTQRPIVELWRPLYTSGIYPPAPLWFGSTNPMKPHFLVYGDMRTALGVSRNAAGQQNIWGNVLNLDMDLQLTSTERFHMLISPLNKATKATGLNFGNNFDVIDAVNIDPVTLFFEGDAGALAAGAKNQFTRHDLPFTFGLIPLVYQNGIWANDAVLGAAMALPARNNRFLKWANYDASLFWATDKITTDAFKGQDHAADMFGSAWFIDAYDGYIEADYAYVADNAGGGRSYHNLAFAFTRRYFSKVSNSVRFIVNMGQDNLAAQNRTADGHLLLIENSFISAYPNVIVPYFNLFYGQGRPQSLARAGLAGGVLTNTGINFETDGITNYPTLDPTGSNTFGFATGVNLLGAQFSHQLVLEFAMLQATGSANLRNAEGDQYAAGLRYQKPLNYRLIFRTDHMVGFRENATNVHGSRFELRWKF